MPAINPLFYDDQTEQQALSTPGAKVIEPPKVGAMAGLFNATGIEAGNIAVTAWNAAKETAAAQFTGQEDLLKSVGADEILKPTRQREIDPETTGTAAKIIAPIAGDMMKLAFGPVAPFIAGEEKRQQTKKKLLDQGIDESTASTVANEQGIETGLLFGLNRIPFSGRLAAISSRALRWTAKGAIGAGVMTGIDAIGGETRATVLEANGYTKQAEQMRPWDGMRVASDILGGAMLGITTQAPELGGKLPSDDELLAGRAAIATDDLIHESAPGIPVDANSSAATAQATQRAMDSITNGDPVNVSDVPGIHDAHFLAKVETDTATAKAQLSNAESEIKQAQERIDGHTADLERAKSDGMDDIAEYISETQLPRWQAAKRYFEDVADRTRDDIHRLENPNGLSRAAEDVRPQLEEHTAITQEMAAKADDLATTPRDTSPAAIAQKNDVEPQRDYVTEAQQMISATKSPIAQALEAPTPGAAAAPKLTPSQQELVNHVNDLRKTADANGDTELHGVLDNIMNNHAVEHAEAGKFSVAALCSIGL
jgi:hypothetical protein